MGAGLRLTRTLPPPPPPPPRCRHTAPTIVTPLRPRPASSWLLAPPLLLLPPLWEGTGAAALCFSAQKRVGVSGGGGSPPLLGK